jgi:hypothetical protein
VSDFVENCANLAATLKSTVKIEEPEKKITKSRAKKSEQQSQIKPEKPKKAQSSKVKAKNSNDRYLISLFSYKTLHRQFL